MPKKVNRPMQRPQVRPPMGRPGMGRPNPMGGMRPPMGMGQRPPMQGQQQRPQEPMIPLSGVVAIVQAATGKAQPQQRPPQR